MTAFTRSPRFRRRPTSRWRARSVVVLALLSMMTPIALGVSAAALPTPSLVGSSTLVPSAPPKVSAVPGNASATVYWTIPSANGSAITNYFVTPYLGGLRQTSIKVGAVRSATIAGLTNAKTYTFHVAAKNAAGVGPEQSSSPITVGAPNAPTGASAQYAKGSFTVHWKAPSTNNGSAITAYVVTPYMHGMALARRTFGSASLSATMSGLTVGTTYTFTVAASNANGGGPGSYPSTPVLLPCVGVPMTGGQADIKAHGTGTTFCLAGKHNWTLTPKAGDKLIGPATLDGKDSTAHAIVAIAPNVTLASLTIGHYNNGNGTQDGAIHIDDSDTTKAAASRWRLANLNVGFNSAIGSGAGDNWTFFAGRFHDNRQEGIGGAIGNGVTVGNVEIDHNDFTDRTYTRRNWSCGDEGGGFKWVTNNVTVENSRIHDNACKGLWADLNGNNAVVTNNLVYNNWDEGIFIEISSGATVTNNIVTGNGWHNYNGGGSGCPWVFGGGITLASSDHAQIVHNIVSGNCNGVTGNQQDRPDGHPGLLENLNIHDNVITGTGVTGVDADNGADLTKRSIVFTNNTFGIHMDTCLLHC